MSSQVKRNLLLVLATGGVILLMILAPAYHYISSSLPNEMKFIFRNWDMSFEKRYKLRFGASFSYLQYLNEHTPTDAVILMPPDSIILDPKNAIKFLPEVTQKNWAAYFVYPRQLVYEKERNTNPLYEKASHIAIIDGWGSDRIHSELNDSIKNGVMPLNP